MRHVLIFSILIFICSSCNPFAASDLNKWIKLSNKYYSIQLLEAYKNYSDDEERTALGTIPQHSFYWRNSALFISDLGLKMLEFSYYDIPKNALSKSNDWILDTCSQFFMKHQYLILSQGRVIENRAVFLNSYPGKFIIACEDIGNEDSLMVFQKLFIAHSRVYTLRATGYKSVLNLPAIDRFMQSFQIKD